MVDSLGTLLDTLSCSNVYACYTDRCHLPSILITNPFQFVMNWNDFELSLLLSLPYLPNSS
nr:MAG TPA: hypothetical protein [Caudoviricetes sp.]